MCDGKPIGTSNPGASNEKRMEGEDEEITIEELVALETMEREVIKQREILDRKRKAVEDLHKVMEEEKKFKEEMNSKEMKRNEEERVSTVFMSMCRSHT